MLGESRTKKYRTEQKPIGCSPVNASLQTLRTNTNHIGRIIANSPRETQECHYPWTRTLWHAIVAKHHRELLEHADAFVGAFVDQLEDILAV